MKSIFAILTVGFLLIPAIVEADEDLSCLQGIKGRVVKWDSEWQMDGVDNNIPYLVTDYSDETPQGAPRKIVLKLSAQGTAAKSERTATIIKGIAATFFCKRVAGGLGDPNRPMVMKLEDPDAPRAASYEIASMYSASKIDPKELSFRRLSNGRWLPANPDAGERIAACQTASGPVGCGENDYRLSMSTVVRKPDTRIELPGPFLKYAQTGWVVAAPVGDYDRVEIAPCPVLGRKFYCLADEKRRWGGELQQLEKDVALLEQISPAPGRGAQKSTQKSPQRNSAKANNAKK